MNVDEQHAANIAHGAVVGRLSDPEFSPGEFVRAEMSRLAPDKRGVFLLRVAVAAVTQHAGTLVGLRDAGLDPIAMLGRAAELRDQNDDDAGGTDEN